MVLAIADDDGAAFQRALDAALDGHEVMARRGQLPALGAFQVGAPDPPDVA